MSKHVDFTKYVIHIEDDGSTIAIARADAPQACECCGLPAEYKLRSSWDFNGQCDIYECQSCLLDDMTDIHVPDSFALIAS